MLQQLVKEKSVVSIARIYEYAMDLIQTHYGFEGLYYDEAMLESMIFYKIVLNNVSGRTHIKKPEEVML